MFQALKSSLDDRRCRQEMTWSDCGALTQNDWTHCSFSNSNKWVDKAGDCAFIFLISQNWFQSSQRYQSVVIRLRLWRTLFKLIISFDLLLYIFYMQIRPRTVESRLSERDIINWKLNISDRAKHAFTSSWSTYSRARKNALHSRKKEKEITEEKTTIIKYTSAKRSERAHTATNRQ